MAELADALDLGSSALGRGSSSLPRRTTIPLLKHALSCTPLAVLTQVVCVIPIQADDSSSIKYYTIYYGTEYFQIEVLQLFSPDPNGTRIHH